MDEPPRFIVPASAAPGAELSPEARSAPDGVLFFRIYTVAVALADVALLGFGYWMILAPVLHASVKLDAAGLITGIMWALLGGAHLVLSIVALAGGRRRWVHTLGFVLVILSLVSCCFTPFGLFVLVVFNKPEVKQYYSE
jgi:hypothetical protein